MATRTVSDGLFMGSAADQLGAGLVPVQGDQRAVQGAGGVVAARVDDHGLARPEAADPRGLVDVAVQAEQRLVLGLDVFYGRTADCLVLDLAQDRLHS